MPRLSIIIPTRNPHGHFCDQCPDRPSYLKKAVESITKHTEDYEIIVVDNDLGLNAKKNYGANRAIGDYLVFLHDDNEVLPGWANEVADVGAFCVGEQSDKFNCWGGLGIGHSYDINHPPDYSEFIVLSRKVYERMGGFDEAYEEPGFQDCDFGRQVRSLGYQIKPLPGKIIHHHVRTAPLSEKNERYFKEKWR